MAQIKGCLKLLRPARHLTVLQRRATNFQYQSSEVEGEMCRRGGLLGLTSPFSGTPHQQFCTNPSMDSVSTASEQDEKLENSTTNKEEQFISGHDIVDITANAVLQSVKSSESFDYLLSVQFYQEKINESNQKISLASFQRMAKLLAKESDETAKEEMTEALLNSYDFEKASYFIHENFQNFDWTYKVSLFSCLVGMTDTDILLTKALGNLLKIHLDNNLDVLVAEKLIEVLLRSKRTKMRRLLFDAAKKVLKEDKANKEAKKVLKEDKANKDHDAELNIETPKLQKDARIPLVNIGVNDKKSFSQLLAQPSTWTEDANSPVIQQIQSQALLNSNKISIPDARIILCLLSSKKIRNAPLINALVARLEEMPLFFKPKSLMSLSFACSVLSINNEEFLNSISNNLIYNMSNFVSLSDMQCYYPVLISFSRLGWKHNEAIRGLIHAVVNLLSVNELDKVKLVSLIISLGHLNWTEHGEVIDSVMDKLEGFEKEDCVRWLDVVWSLSILNKATVKMVHRVLKEEYYHSIEQSVADKPKYVLTSIQSKLLSLTGHAALELKAPVKPAAYDIWMANFKDAHAEYKNPLAQSVGKILLDLASAQSCSSKKVLDYGNIVDFELHEVQVAEKKTLERVAVKVLRFQDMLRSPYNAEPDGRTAMSIRQLKHMGYHVLVVPYNEWARDNYEKEAYLRDLMQEASEDL